MTDKTQAYKAVIDILMNPDLDNVGLVREIAKEAPEVLVAAYEKLNPAPAEPKWLRDAKALIKVNNKIAAIKEVRAATGWGLKESKDFVESDCKVIPQGCRMPSVSPLNEVR